MGDPRLQIVIDAVNRTNRAFKDAEKDIDSFGAKAKALAPIVGAALAGAAAAGAVAVVNAAADYQEAFTGVRKTVDASEADLKELEQGFRELAKEIPVSAIELANIGAIAGQLGIQSENILEFTETISQLATTTNLSAPEAAQQLAQFANITGLAQTDIDQLGSSIVALGNNMATTERDIVAFGLRIAGAGQLAGFTEAETLAVAAALSSLGIEAEAGGTAVQKVLIDMTNAVATGNEQLDVFARVAGMSAAEFSELWERDAAGAFNAFVQGLGKQGDQAFATLDELGLQDARLIRSFTALAQSGDLLTEAIELSSDAFDENTALTKEAELRYQDFNQQMELLKNQINDIAISVGEELLPVLSELITELGPLIELLGDATVATTKLGKALVAIEPHIRLLLRLAEAYRDIQEWSNRGAEAAAFFAEQAENEAATLGELSGRIEQVAKAKRDVTQATEGEIVAARVSVDLLKAYREEAIKALDADKRRALSVIDNYREETAWLEARRQAQLDAIKAEADFARAVRDSEQALKAAAKADREYLDQLSKRADEGMTRSLNEHFARQRMGAEALNQALQLLIDSGIDRLAAQSIVTGQAMAMLDAEMRDLAAGTELGKSIINQYKDGLIGAADATAALEELSRTLGNSTDELADSLEAANEEYERLIQNAVQAGGLMLLPGQQVITPELRNYWIALDKWRNDWRHFMDNMGPDPGPMPQPPAESFDAGGVVGGAIGQPRLIMAHGGETILPTHRSGMGGLGLTVVVNVQGDVLGLDDLDTHILRTVRNGVMRGGFQGVIKRDG